MNVVITLSPRDCDAVLFDLDGVLTRTAGAHAAAWKRLFDGFLKRRATRRGEPYVPFDIAADYRRYVDGKPRHDGVTAFLESRGIELPLGAPEDGPDARSVHALGNLKDEYFLEHLRGHGVDRYEVAIALVQALRAQENKTAVVSSSNNCAAVADGIHYPWTYLGGGYNRLRTDIAGRVVENEGLVNFPNWLALGFRIADQDGFDAGTVTLLSYRQELDLRRGILSRSTCGAISTFISGRRSGVRLERPDAAPVEHVPPAARRIAQLHRARHRRTRAGMDRGGVPGPCCERGFRFICRRF